MASSFLAVACGGGRNMAMLIGMYERGIRPDVITFADTGSSEANPDLRDGEKPETYDVIESFSEWCRKHFATQITWARKRSRYKSLYDNCLQTKTLPSAAYGLRSCSDKWKIQPQDRFLNNYAPALAVWNTCNLCHKPKEQHAKHFIRDAAGEFVRIDGKRISRRFCTEPDFTNDIRSQYFQMTAITKAIGYHAGEQYRIDKSTDSDKYTFWFPLMEWGWFTEECIEAFKRHGLRVPIKSACYFCPSSTKEEVLWLAEHHPELYERAVALEDNAEDLRTVKGLGRHWTWKELVQIDQAQLSLLPNPPKMACACFDTEDD